MNTEKTHILAHATQLFLDHGFKSVTMDEISSSLGISKKTLYAHFSNKASLVDASVMQVYDTICCGIEHICETSLNPIEELYDIKRKVMDTLKGDKTSPIHQLQRYYPQVHGKVTKMQFDYMQDCIGKNLERGIEQGLYIPTMDRAFVSRIYFIGMQGIKDLSIFPVRDFPVQQLYDQYLEYHLRGIVTPAGRKILNQITNQHHD
jgi:AcrR family transcriptional regulator